MNIRHVPATVRMTRIFRQFSRLLGISLSLTTVRQHCISDLWAKCQSWLTLTTEERYLIIAHWDSNKLLTMPINSIKRWSNRCSPTPMRTFDHWTSEVWSTSHQLWESQHTRQPLLRISKATIIIIIIIKTIKMLNAKAQNDCKIWKNRDLSLTYQIQKLKLHRKKTLHRLWKKIMKSYRARGLRLS